MSVFVVRAFVKMRELPGGTGELARQLKALEANKSRRWSNRPAVASLKTRFDLAATRMQRPPELGGIFPALTGSGAVKQWRSSAEG